VDANPVVVYVRRFLMAQSLEEQLATTTRKRETRSHVTRSHVSMLVVLAPGTSLLRISTNTDKRTLLGRQSPVNEYSTPKLLSAPRPIPCPSNIDLCEQRIFR